MSPIRNKIFLLETGILFLVIYGCAASRVPGEYRFKPRELELSTTGCWTIVITDSLDILHPGMRLDGELIAAQSDTLYLLTPSMFIALPVNEIKKAEVTIFRNPGHGFLSLSGIMILPNLIAALAYGIPEFLLVDIPWIAAGSVASISELSGGNSSLEFPAGCQLTDLARYSRFPQGLPKDLAPKKLNLNKSGKRIPRNPEPASGDLH